MDQPPLHNRARPSAPLLLAFLLLQALLLQACGSSKGLQIRRVPSEGYDQTTNYQFQARVRLDSLNRCQHMLVRAEALSKLYATEEPPPSRLQLVDSDCLRPIQFESARYLSQQTGGPVILTGPEVTRFLNENSTLESELFAWLFEHGLTG